MKIYHSYTGQGTHSQQHMQLSVGLKNKINILILAHLVTFALYNILGWIGSLNLPFGEETIDHFIKYMLALSSRAQDLHISWSTGIVTYQFIHFNIGEVILSLSMLWLFGHILQNRIGQSKVVILYFIFVTISAVIFNISHVIFPIYSGPSEIMDGAFGGVLGIMTTTVFLYGKSRIEISKGRHLQLWHVYVAAVLLSFLWVYKNNMAHILVYICNMYVGARYASVLKEKKAA